MPKAVDLEHVLLNQIAIMRMLDVMATSLGVSNIEPSVLAVLRHRLSQTTKLYKQDPEIM
jgi:hypothetical protein